MVAGVVSFSRLVFGVLLAMMVLSWVGRKRYPPGGRLRSMVLGFARHEGALLLVDVPSMRASKSKACNTFYGVFNYSGCFDMARCERAVAKRP